MLRLGSHVSMKAPDMLLGSANEAASYGANTFMIYTGAPQNTRRKPIDELKIDEAQPIIEAHDLRQIVVHAPYIINLGNTKKPGYFEFATDFLYQEIQRADAVGATQLTLHPGAHIECRSGCCHCADHQGTERGYSARAARSNRARNDGWQRN